MGTKEVIGVIVLVVSLLVLLIGYLIGARKQLNLIAGLNMEQVKDADGLAKWIGNGLLGLGLIDLIISVLMLAVAIQTRWFVIVLVVLNIGGAGVLLSRLRRFLK